MNNKKKIKLSALVICALSCISCSLPLNNNLYESANYTSTSSFNKYAIQGKADFGSKFNTKATVSEVGNKATISLITPYDDATPNVTLATGLTDALGGFNINLGFTPVINKIYLLQASKRIGSATKRVININTYIMWDGNYWQSITGTTININEKTTAVTIIDYHDNSITPGMTMNKIYNGAVSDIGTVLTNTINEVISITNSLLTNNTDPIRFIGFANNNYYILKENNFNLGNTSFINADLSGQDFSNANFSNKNLSYANLKNTVLTNANFTGATLTNTDFTGAIWIDGRSICDTGSIGKCVFSDVPVNTYINGNQSSHSIAMDSQGNFIVVWQSFNQTRAVNDIYAQRFNSSGVPVGREFRVNSNNQKQGISPSVSMNANGNFIVVWRGITNDQGGGLFTITAKRYNNSGEAIGSEFIVNQPYYFVNNPVVSIDDTGNFVIAWESMFQDGGDNGIYIRKYKPDGLPFEAEKRANMFTSGNQEKPDIILDNLGFTTVVWQSNGQSGNNDIYFQKFDVDLKHIDINGVYASPAETRVNNYTSGNQSNPSITKDSMGNFAISWDSFDQDGSDSGIYAQKFERKGNPNKGSDTPVNTYITGSQMNSDIAMDSLGNYIVTWDSFGQDGSSNGIYAQRFNNLNVPQGSEFKVNSYTLNNQSNSSIASDSNGNFSIAWESFDQDGTGIYFHKYNNQAQLTR